MSVPPGPPAGPVPGAGRAAASGAGTPPPPPDAPSADDPAAVTGPPNDGPDPTDPPSDSVGAGQDASAATARPGQSTLRKGLLRQAESKVTGDFVAGDKIVILGAGERPITLRTISPATVTSVRHSYHAPPRWDEIRTNSWRQRSVVLRGPNGSGRTTSAVRLLISARANSWFLLDSVADLARLTTLDQLSKGAGLLLSHPRDISELRGPLLESLEHLLEQAGAHLVLTVDTEAALHRGVAEYVQQLTRPPDLGAVLEAHLRTRIGEQRTEELLARAEVGKLTADLLDEAAACRDAARLAAVLADEVADGGLDMERVRTLLDQSGGEDPVSWFTSLDDPSLRVRAVALAVLNSLPQEDVALAESALAKRLDAAGPADHGAPGEPSPPEREPFSGAGRVQWERLRARTVRTVVRSGSGWVPCTIAEYRDDRHPALVIRHAWSEYRVQSDLLGWLSELVDSASDRVRSFAGIALGVIATEAFDLLGTRVFPAWVHDERYGSNRREAVAYALRVCADDPALRGNVRALVESWYLSGNWRAQAAAARAFGLCLGGADLATAVESLARLGTVNHIQVAVAIGDSFADLIEDDVPNNAGVVLQTLVRMVGRHESRACGHLAFLIIADALVTEDRPQAGGAPRSRPTLLRLSVEDERLRDQLARLWGEVIGGELFSAQAAQVLGRWAALAEGDPLLLDDLLRTLRDLAQRDARTKQLLLNYTRSWDARDSLRPLPRSATVLRQVLSA